MAGLKIFADLMSQPSRALIIFARAAKVPHEFKKVDLRNGEHYQEDYIKNVHRFSKVPAIIDNGYNLTESVAILRYITRQYNVPDHWYPKDSKQQARVDEFLEWQHIGCRVPLSMYFRTKFLDPLITGKAPKQSSLEIWKDRMVTALDEMENVWLEKNPFLAGDKITIADLIGACEVEQPRMAGYDPREGRPKLSAWLDRVKKEVHPHYEDAHVILNKVVEKFKGAPPSSLSKL